MLIFFSLLIYNLLQSDSLLFHYLNPGFLFFILLLMEDFVLYKSYFLLIMQLTQIPLTIQKHIFFLEKRKNCNAGIGIKLIYHHESCQSYHIKSLFYFITDYIIICKFFILSTPDLQWDLVNNFCHSFCIFDVCFYFAIQVGVKSWRITIQLCFKSLRFLTNGI